MNNARFATAIHILVLLAMKRDELLSSDFIAGSININSAIVRKELSSLRDYGLIQSKEGKGGGTRLARGAEHIYLSDVYRAVKQSPLLGRFNDPNVNCPIGRQINHNIKEINQRAEQALLERLRGISLADFVKQFN
ncbi:Rrf2 family transcriptional regulator [Pedobacter sp. SYSU D00535]|uniref:RrF2 family transcriptional regulator n=1 Tax=Pedobacter sp. SYSU D00535 TaxID=2810308 RepID=UPI001A968DE0|nr:Rrf2 family transcriptional regulator [Pedobacter sp. SYSU D00535]